MELLRERPVFVIAKEYGTSPAEIRGWSDYDFQRAWTFFLAEHTENPQAEEVRDSIEARLGADMAEGILEHVPSYWTSRTREQVTEEGYNAPFVAEELAKVGLALVGESVAEDKPKRKGKEKAVDDNDLTTGPLEQPAE